MQSISRELAGFPSRVIKRHNGTISHRGWPSRMHSIRRPWSVPAIAGATTREHLGGPSTAWPLIFTRLLSTSKSIVRRLSRRSSRSAQRLPRLCSPQFHQAACCACRTALDSYTPAHQPMPSVDQWNLMVEHVFPSNLALSAGYVGNVARHLNSGFQMNSAVPGPRPLNPRRPLFNLFGLTQGVFDKCDCSSSNYNSI
jgi:hypothetical protein